MSKERASGAQEAAPRTTRWTSQGSFVRIFARNDPKFAIHAALRSIPRGKLTLDERVVPSRVVPDKAYIDVAYFRMLFQSPLLW